VTQGLRLYLDEDAMPHSLVLALRARHVDVVTAFEAKMINRNDEDHLRWATEHGRAVYTFNIGDYRALHSTWLQEGRSHAGIILAIQQRYSVGEQARRLLRIIHNRPNGLNAQIEYLSGWD
jgi:hypothetical protein